MFGFKNDINNIFYCQCFCDLFSYLSVPIIQDIYQCISGIEPLIWFYLDPTASLKTYAELGSWIMIVSFSSSHIWQTELFSYLLIHLKK